MSKKIRMRATLTYEYDADPNHYLPEDQTPERMALVDTNEGVAEMTWQNGDLKVEVVA